MRRSDCEGKESRLLYCLSATVKCEKVFGEVELKINLEFALRVLKIKQSSVLITTPQICSCCRADPAKRGDSSPTKLFIMVCRSSCQKLWDVVRTWSCREKP